MSEKSLTKNIVLNYHSTIIPLCKLLKPHATNIMLLPDNRILLQPIIAGIRNYMIVNQKYDYSNFVYTYISLPEVSKINTKFRKTKSEISWEVEDYTNYLVVKNPEMDSCKLPIINNASAVEDIVTSTYSNIPGWEYSKMSDLLSDDNSSEYNKLSDNFIENMIDKKLCELSVDNKTILLSRPFLGDLKKTLFAGYKVVCRRDDEIVLKFKQSEECGDIYTYAAFLTV